MFADVVIPKTPLDGLTYYFDPAELGGLNPGDLVEVQLRKRRVVGVVFSTGEECNFAPGQTLPVVRLIYPGFLSSDLLALTRWVGDYYLVHLGNVLGLIIPGWVRKRFKISWEPYRSPTVCKEIVRSELPVGLESAIGAGKFGVWVFTNRANFENSLFTLIKQGLMQGSVVILIPEWSFDTSPAILGLLREKFEGVLVEYHHRLTLKKRWEVYQKIIAPGNHLVVGGRSAVWLPVRKLTSLVVINEHSPAYKETRIPRYNARDVAVARAKFAGCPVVFYDITPSVETWFNIKSRRYTVVDQPVVSSVRDLVFVVDMRQHRREVLSPRLIKNLHRVVEQKKGALCYINRKGVSRWVMCQDCGTVLKCPGCLVPLLLTGDGKVSCNICGYKDVAPDRCCRCQGANFQYRAIGVELVQRLLKQKAIFSTLVTADLPVNVEYPFADTVLVGTKKLLSTVSGGNLGLIGLINFDSELTRPDFRTRERAFQLLFQLRELARSARARMIIQTYRPDDPVLEWMIRGDVVSFLNSELSSRKEAGFPPYKRLIAMTVAGDEPVLGAELEKITARLCGIPGVDVLGPLKLGRQQQKVHKCRLILKIPRNVIPARIIDRKWIDSLRVTVKIDVDPQEIL